MLEKGRHLPRAPPLRALAKRPAHVPPPRPPIDALPASFASDTGSEEAIFLSPGSIIRCHERFAVKRVKRFLWWGERRKREKMDGHGASPQRRSLVGGSV